ncbi:MAG TPA: ABC transporter permease [Terriglobia bacterium]|nr:ABC transporter permease [Terriglobia bacterium]
MRFLAQDLRYAFRMLAKRPGATAVVVLSLALGIGANSAIFSLVNALLFRPPAVHEPGRLADIWLHNKKASGFLEGYYPLSFPDYIYYRDHNSVFSGVAALAGDGTTVIWNRNGQGEALQGILVSANYFSVVGVPLKAGRGFLPEDDAAAGRAVALVSESFARRLGGDQEALGTTLMLNGRTCAIVGVVPGFFHNVMADIAPDLWMPMGMQTTISPSLDLTSRNENFLEVYGRLRPGVTWRQAGANLLVLSRQLAQSYPDTEKNFEAQAYRAALIPGPFRGFLSIITAALMAVVALVLLIACANAANLLLAQSSARAREMAVRSALGAGRWRLLRQPLTESVLLGCLGGAAGLLLAAIAVPLLLRLKPPGLPVEFEAPLDWRVLGFTLAAGVLAGVVFGLAPALRASRLDVSSRLKDGTAAAGQGRSRLRSFLVTAQVAVCLVLLIGAGLCLRSLGNARSIDPGFDTRNGLVASLDVETLGYDKTRGPALYQDLLGRVSALPGVRSVSMADMMPLGTAESVEGVVAEGSKTGDVHGGRTELTAGSLIVAPGYFRTMGIPLLEGRDFSAADNARAPKVVIINDTMARRAWPGRNPVGRRITRGSGKDRETLEVLGVVKTGKYRTLGEDPRPFMYHPYAQNYAPLMHLIVRTAGDNASVLDGMRRVVQALDPHLALYDVETLQQLMLLPLFPARAAGLLFGVLGTIALLLAMGGLYGVISYLVALRTHEVGIRMALGARAGDVMRLVVGNGMRLALAGVAVGLAGAFALTRLLSSLLYGIGPADLATFAAIALALSGVAFLASYIPARRATKVDPMVALRHE